MNQLGISYFINLIIKGLVIIIFIAADNFIRKKNGGPSSARNLGLNKSKHEFICFFDVDEWIYIFKEFGYKGDYEFIFFE